MLYLEIRLRSEDLKHIIPVPVYPDYRVRIPDTNSPASFRNASFLINLIYLKILLCIIYFILRFKFQNILRFPMKMAFWLDPLLKLFRNIWVLSASHWRLRSRWRPTWRPSGQTKNILINWKNWKSTKKASFLSCYPGSFTVNDIRSSDPQNDA